MSAFSLSLHDWEQKKENHINYDILKPHTLLSHAKRETHFSNV